LNILGFVFRLDPAQRRLQELIDMISAVEKQHDVDTFYTSTDINTGARDET
jgi:hypothetical protein